MISTAVLLKELEALPPERRRRILLFLQQRLAVADDPRSNGKALAGPRLGDFWRYRIGDDRLIARIDDNARRVLILRMGHRRDIYR